MTSVDRNLLSFNGPADSGKQLDFSSVNLVGAGYADTVKCSSGLLNFSAEFGEIISGAEDAADVNNECENIALTARRWLLCGTMGLTAKGGSKNVRFNGEVDGRGKECDVDLGNHSDQSKAKTTGTHLNLWRHDRKTPIRVRVLNAAVPTFEPGSGPYEYVFPKPHIAFHGFFVWGFQTLRKVGFFR